MRSIRYIHPFPNPTPRNKRLTEQVTGSQTLKLVHDRFKGKPTGNVLQELTADMKEATKANREIPKHLGNAMEDLSALRVGDGGLVYNS